MAVIGIVQPEKILYEVNKVFFETEGELRFYCEDNNISLGRARVVAYFSYFAGRKDVFRIRKFEGGDYRTIDYKYMSAVDEDGYAIYNPIRSEQENSNVWEFWYGDIKKYYAAFAKYIRHFQNDVYKGNYDADPLLEGLYQLFGPGSSNTSPDLSSDRLSPKSELTLYSSDNKFFTQEELERYYMECSDISTLNFYKEFAGKKDVIGITDSNGETTYIYQMNSKKIGRLIYNENGVPYWEEADESYLTLYAEFVKRGVTFRGFTEPEMVLESGMRNYFNREKTETSHKVEFFQLFEGNFDVIRVGSKCYKFVSDKFYEAANTNERDSNGELIWELEFVDLINVLRWYLDLSDMGIKFVDHKINYFLRKNTLADVSVVDYLTMGLPENINSLAAMPKAYRTIYRFNGKNFDKWLPYMFYCLSCGQSPTKGEKLEYFTSFEGDVDVFKVSKPGIGSFFTLYKAVDDSHYFECDSRKIIYCGKIIWEEKNGSIEGLYKSFNGSVIFVKPCPYYGKGTSKQLK